MAISNDWGSLYPFVITRFLQETKIKTYRDVSGSFHNEDGPAIIWSGGSLDWRIHNEVLTFNEWCERLNKSDAEKARLLLIWA